MAENRRRRVALLLLGAVFAPPAIVSVFGVLGHPLPETLAVGTVQLGFLLAIIVGTACVARLPIRQSVRTCLVIAYLPTSILALFCFGLIFSGYVFDEWL